MQYATGGTVLACRLALEHGVAINPGGSYHHAASGWGGGFCVYADVPLAVKILPPGRWELAPSWPGSL
jgi:histone deacetylase 11